MNDRAFLPPLPRRSSPEQLRARLERRARQEPDLLAGFERAGGVLVDASERPGHRIVTFLRPVCDPAESALVLIGTLTHLLRERLDHFLLDRAHVRGVAVHAAAFELPSRFRGTVSLLIQPALDLTIGADRERWRAVYGRTVPLSRAVEVIRAVEGGRATVLALPDAPETFPAGSEATGAARRIAPEPGDLPRVPAATVHRASIRSAALGVEMSVWAAAPHPAYGAPVGVLICADGDRLQHEYPVLPGLDALHASGRIAPTLVIGYAPVRPADRPLVLGMHDRLSEFLLEELLPWAGARVPVPAEAHRRAVAGASLGGLAAADLVRQIPDQIANAAVQSASFWWPIDHPTEPAGLQLRLWSAAAPGLAGRIRIFHEVGDTEGDMVVSNREFRDILRGAGIEHRAREYTGGHDFACWRVGLLDAIQFFFPAE